MRYNAVLHGSPNQWDMQRKHYKGGGSSPSTVTQTTTQQLPDYAKPYAVQLMTRGAELSNKAYTPYGGQRIADLNSNQQTGLSMTKDQALNGFQGQNDVGNTYQQTVRGDYLDPSMNWGLGAVADQYGNLANGSGLDMTNNSAVQTAAGLYGDTASGAGLDMNNNAAINKINSLYGSTANGSYLNPSSNPYLQSTADAIGTNFNKTTGAQNASMQRTAGAFGNSGLNEKMSMDNSQLAGSLNNLYGANYSAERGNQLAAQGQIGNAYQSQYSQALQNQLAAQGQINNTVGNQYSQALQNQMAAKGAIGNAATGAYNNARSDQLQAMQLAPQMQNMGYTDSKQLLGAGDIQRSYTQDLLNQQYGDWQAQQNQPYANLDTLQKAISGSIGNAGTTMQTSPNPYQANPYASMIGGGLSGAALGSAMFGNSGNAGLIGGAAGGLGSLLF